MGPPCQVMGGLAPRQEERLEGESTARGQRFNQSLLCSEASIRPQQDGVWRAPGWCSGDLGERGGPGGHGSALPLPHSLPYVSVPSAVS